MPNVEDIEAWEKGTLNAEAEARFFQELVDTGSAWELQGMYGRRAVQLIAAGAVKVEETSIPPMAKSLLDSIRSPA